MRKQRKAVSKLNDQLLNSFKSFSIQDSVVVATTGGQGTSGNYHDEDGCTASWTDCCDGTMTHIEDHTRIM